MTSRPPWKVSSSKWCSSLSAKIKSTCALLKYIFAMEVWKMTVERREVEVPTDEQALCTLSIDRLSSIWRHKNDISLSACFKHKRLHETGLLDDKKTYSRCWYATVLTLSQFQCGFPTHSQAEVPSLRSSNVSADLCCFSEDRPFCDDTVSGGVPIKWEEWLEAVNEAWPEEDHHQQEHNCLPGSHDAGWRRRNLNCYRLLYSAVQLSLFACFHFTSAQVLWYYFSHQKSTEQKQEFWSSIVSAPQNAEIPQ